MEKFFTSVTFSTFIIPLIIVVAVVLPNIIIIVVLIKVIPMLVKAQQSVSPQARAQKANDIISRGGVQTTGIVKSIQQTGMQFRTNGIQYINVSVVLEVEQNGVSREITGGIMMDLVNPVTVGTTLPVVINFVTGECMIVK